MSKNITVEEIIAAIHQAAFDGQDIGNRPEDDDEKVGLQRDATMRPLIDRRVVDGFQVRLNGANLAISYTTPVTIKDFHNIPQYTDTLDQNLTQIVTFLKKRFKNQTGSDLSLSQVGEPQVTVQGCSNRRQANIVRNYAVGNLKSTQMTSEEEQAYSWQETATKFIKMGGLKNAKWS